MTPSLRFVHLSDTHLGYRQYGLPERLDDWNRATREIIEYAIHKQADCVIHSGDMFDSNKVDYASLIHAIEALRPLKDAGIPFFVIDGNHDRKKGPQTHTAIDVLQRLDLCTYLRPERDNLENATAQVNGTNVIGLGYHGAYLRSRLEELSERMPPGPNVVVLHAAVAKHIEGGQPEVTVSELNVLRPTTAYLALGHYHNSFSVNKWIFNPGSPEYYRFSDLDAKRCFFDVTLRDGIPKVDKIAVRSTRRMESVEIEYTGEDYALLEAVQTRLDDANMRGPLADSLLRIILKGEVAKPPNVNELKQFVEERYEPLFCTVLDNTSTRDDALADIPGTLDDLERRMFEASFSDYNEQREEVASFARTVLREVISAELSSTEDAESIAQYVSRFRRERL